MGHASGKIRQADSADVPQATLDAWTIPDSCSGGRSPRASSGADALDQPDEYLPALPLGEAHAVVAAEDARCGVLVDGRLRGQKPSREERNLASAQSVLADEALDKLITFYDETDRGLRFTLAALQTAAEHAADVRAERVAPGHVRAAVND